MSNKKKQITKKKSGLKIGRRIQSQHLQNILNDSPDGLVIFDTNNIILEWNKGASEIFGYTRDEVIGRKFDFLIPANLKKSSELTDMQKTLNEVGYIKNHVTERLRKDGKRITVEITRTPIKNKHGKIISYSALVRDKSEFTELNKLLLQTEKLAALGQLISGFAHEIGTPLNVIVGNAELMLMELDTNDSKKVYLQKIIATAERVSDLIKRLLQFSSPKFNMNDDVDVNRIIEDLYIFLRKQLEKNNIKVQLTLSRNLPFIYGDGFQLEEIFLNIMINAWHAMPNGGILSIKTSVTNEKNKSFVDIRFGDTGIGIPEDILPRIFEPFFTTKDIKKGTGLGLYVAHNLVQIHNGMIRVKSKPGKGTIFHILLPVSEKQKDTSISG